MANKTHISILKKGTVAWNPWRKQNPNARIDLHGADLRNMDLSSMSLRGADFRGADLQSAFMMGTNLTNATLTNCWVYGTSVWDVMLRGTRQSGLIITRRGEPVISVDNLEVAQFIYILLYNEKIRHVINTITSKVVLIL